MKRLFLLVTTVTLFAYCRQSNDVKIHPDAMSLSKKHANWVKNYDLAIKNAVLYRMNGRFVYKTIQNANSIKSFYESKFKKLKFRKISELNQEKSIALHFEKKRPNTIETISIVIDSLPHSSNNLIRLGRVVQNINLKESLKNGSRKKI